MSELMLQAESGVVAKAEIDTMIATAKAYPRDERRAIEKAVMLATMDEETAQSCIYALPRKDKDGNKVEIKGASVRLAEIMISVWGNIHAATRIVEVAEKHITTAGVCWDLETNVRVEMPEKVSIWFGEKGGKGGYRANNDMQVMLTKASCSKALRNAIFRVIPKALIDRVYAKALECAIGDVKTVSSKVKKVVDKLVKMGINQAEMLEYFGHSKIDDFTAEDYTALIGIGTALKDGMIKPEEVFKAESNNAAAELNANEKINELIASKKRHALANEETGEILKNNDDLPY